MYVLPSMLLFYVQQGVILEQIVMGLDCACYDLLCSGSWFNIKISYWYKNSHCGDKMVIRLIYLHNGNSYIGKMASWYRISHQMGNSGTVTIVPTVVYCACCQVWSVSMCVCVSLRWISVSDRTQQTHKYSMMMSSIHQNTTGILKSQIPNSTY